MALATARNCSITNLTNRKHELRRPRNVARARNMREPGCGECAGALSSEVKKISLICGW